MAAVVIAVVHHHRADEDDFRVWFEDIAVARDRERRLQRVVAIDASVDWIADRLRRNVSTNSGFSGIGCGPPFLMSNFPSFTESNGDRRDRDEVPGQAAERQRLRVRSPIELVERDAFQHPHRRLSFQFQLRNERIRERHSLPLGRDVARAETEADTDRGVLRMHGACGVRMISGGSIHVSRRAGGRRRAWRRRGRSSAAPLP